MGARAVEWVGALALALIALGLTGGLLHPSEVFAPGSNPCDGHRFVDALVYALGAAVVAAAALCAVSLARRQAPTWLAIVGVGALLLGALTRSTRTFGCVSEAAYRPADHFNVLAAGLAIVAAASVGTAFVCVTKRRGPGEGQVPLAAAGSDDE